jgi:hypothetical protein
MTINTTLAGPPWDEADILLWREFLSTTTGQRVIAKALDGVPPLLPSGDTNAILIRSGEVRGWAAAAQAILGLAAPLPTPSSSVSDQFPDLDDDSRWDTPTPTS